MMVHAYNLNSEQSGGGDEFTSLTRKLCFNKLKTKQNEKGQQKGMEERNDVKEDSSVATVNPHCQEAWTWNHLEGHTLSISVRTFPKSDT